MYICIHTEMLSWKTVLELHNHSSVGFDFSIKVLATNYFKKMKRKCMCPL